MIPFIHEALAQNVTVPSTPGQEAGTAVEASGIVPACATKLGGADTLDCALQLFINVADIMLGVVGAIFLAVVVWGGILYLTSRGDSGKVQKATKMMLGSVVGLLIVFGAFSGVQYGVNILRGGDAGSQNSVNFVTCGTVAVPENEGQRCGPRFICQQGVCVDLVEELIN